MDTSYFYTFKEVVKWGSYTKAGEELGYAQSSVTAQMRKLEQYYQIKLFERVGQKMCLTQSGEELFYYVQTMIDLLEEAKDKVSQEVQMRGTLRIGTVESLAAYYITNAIKVFKTENPDLRIKLESGLCPNLKSGILEGQYDVAILLDHPLHHPHLNTVPLKKENMVFVSSPAHSFSKKERLDIEWLKDETLIFTEKGCTYRESLESLLKGQHIQPRSTLSFTSLEAIKQCVVDELGIAMLPAMAVQEELKSGKLISLNFDVDLHLHVQLVYQQKKWLSPSIQRFIDLLEEGKSI
ncbi:LysR family transcriptional regulator [Halobacillus locisalis]|uniref:LysR family transcriptional regulator n=1 Tax=Halobacillus locisalis TaxID=220753 RepID=A0A838CUW0_9BACI|nr:LysR family transcriptional regulator [Halobacillus locisalis]MBA2175693.1 LysR family transcriptional regulator [Halobacillus locisalis]